MRALMIANATDADAGFVGHALRERGFAFTELIREQHHTWDEVLTGTLDGIDMVLSLGSSWSVYWESASGPVSTETALLRRALATDVPVLGVCFGAQMLAHAAGGHVRRAAEHEIGWCEVRLTREAPADSSSLAGSWMQWHYDCVEVPSGATTLAESDKAVQAFRVGSSLAVQFHPEATESIVSRWSSGDGRQELADAGVDYDTLMVQTRSETASAEGRSRLLVDWFLRNVAKLHV
jgi:GMP synthase-like glutamine amidotransferase